MAFAFSACGDGGGGGTQPPAQTGPVQQMRTDTAFADDYYVDDLACQSETGVSDIGSTPVNLYKGGAASLVPYAFAQASATDALKAPGFSGTYFGFYQSTACAEAQDAGSCTGEAQVVHDKEPLRICRSGGSYPRTSVEGVALASLANLETAYAFYETLPGHATSLAAASLLILPTVDTVYAGGTKRYVKTDNLEYAPSFGGAPAFVIYPKGQTAAAHGLWKNLNLWELPWGLAHEFGHHVFRTHTHIASLSDTTEGLGSPAPIRPFEGADAPDLEDAGTRVTGSATVWSAVNEGYADLYAYYTEGSEAGQLTGVDCFATNRDVAAAAFATGIPKALTQDVLNTFASPEKIAVTGGCDVPSFQDVHMLGAIVAHGVDQVYSAMVGAASGPDAATKKAALLLAWADRLGATVPRVGQNNLSFDVLVKDALTVAAGGGTRLNAAACAAVRQSFPAYANQWLAGAFTCQ